MSDSNNPTQNDTLTFVDEEMTYEEVKRIFGCYGELKNVNKYCKRFFIQFEIPQEAEMALSDLEKKYKVTYAHARSRPRPKKNFRAEGELIRLWNPEDLPRIGNSEPREISCGMAMIRDYVRTTGKHLKACSRFEMAKGAEHRSEYDKALVDRKEKESRKSAKHDQRREPAAKPKPGTSRVYEPERDSSGYSDDNIEEPKARKSKAGKPKAGKPKAGKPKAGKPKAEEVHEYKYSHPRENEEDDIEAQARALSDSCRIRVKIEGIDDIMNELSNDFAYSVIVANIPAKYTLAEVYDLVEEVKPIALSEMDYSIKMRVKFCEVFVNDVADVNYLKRKLNEFVICGKQLTVMEPAEILEEARWIA